MNNSTNASVEVLSVLLCLLIDFKEGGIDCSETENVCVQFSVRGAYFSGESVDDINSSGHLISDILWLLTLIIGGLGVLANILIVVILRKRTTNFQQSFNFMLMVLACFDSICCISNMNAASFQIIFLNNWVDRDTINFHWHKYAFVIALLGRTLSVYLSVLITVERYLKIAYSIRTRDWFTPRRTKVMVVLVIVTALVVNIATATGDIVKDNIYGVYGADIESVRNLQQIIVFGNIGFFWRLVITILDFALPTTLLIIFNCLTCYEIRKFSRRREEMNMSQKKEINSTKLFLPVIVVLLLSNIGPIATMMVMGQQDLVYREMYMSASTTMVITSAINFPIYYAWSSVFREEAKALFASIGDKVSFARRTTVTQSTFLISGSGSGSGNV